MIGANFCDSACGQMSSCVNFIKSRRPQICVPQKLKMWARNTSNIFRAPNLQIHGPAVTVWSYEKSEHFKRKTHKTANSKMCVPWTLNIWDRKTSKVQSAQKPQIWRKASILRSRVFGLPLSFLHQRLIAWRTFPEESADGTIKQHHTIRGRKK